MKMKNIFLVGAASFLMFNLGCNKFIDIVPDNVPVIDQAFGLRTMTLRYLATCYNKLPSSTNTGNNPGYFGADEFWLNSTTFFNAADNAGWYLAMGQQNSNSPLIDLWGSDGRGEYWQGIYSCNVLIARINEVPDMEESEKRTLAAEAKVLKAYYHFLLLRAYGPIIIRDVNKDVYTEPADLQEERISVDQCFNYIVSTLDAAIPDLLPNENALGEGGQIIGRITQVVAKTLKAQILVEAASPLFNGNTDQAGLKNVNGESLFNQTFAAEKWTLAAQAAREAIDFAHENGKQLNMWTAPGNVTVNSPNTVFQMNYRTAFNESEDNPEGLWYDTNNIAGSAFQGWFYPRGLNANTVANGNIRTKMGATLNMAEKFYSNNGVPIEEDIDYPYNSRFALTTVPNSSAYKADLQVGYSTVYFHLDREPRFYGALSIDGGRYFMASQGSDFALENANTITNYKGTGNIKVYSAVFSQSTGYTAKKYVNYQNTFGASSAYSARDYVVPIIRLADLYLLYAEALNEAVGPNDDVYDYVDRVRARSGLKTVVESWADHSTNPAKPLSRSGMREIIKRERAIELAFEGKRFWDLRRWKDSFLELNTNIQGWSVTDANPQTFYRARTLYSRTFTSKDYFWPISLDELRRNPKLIQNIGW